MGFMSYWEKKIRQLSIWDFGVMKIALILFGMVLGAYVAGFVHQYVWWFVVVFVVLYIWLVYRVLGR